MEDSTISTIKVLFAMGCITLLEAVAMMQGIDGSLLGLVVAAIAGLGGYELHKRKTE